MYQAMQKQWLQQLSAKLSLDVRVHINAKGKGRVVIRFEDPSEADWLVDRIARD